MHCAMEFRFTDTNENALGQLFGLIDLMGGRGGPFSMRDGNKTDTTEVRLVDIIQEEETHEPPPPPPPKPPKNVKMKKYTPIKKKEQ